MSDGMSDAAAESQLYRDLWCAVLDLREVLGHKWRTSRWPENLVAGVNELISDLTTYHGKWRFELARYAEPVFAPTPDAETAAKLWAAVEKLREALHWVNVGHRGWSPGIDPEVDGLLAGTGYVFVQR